MKRICGSDKRGIYIGNPHLVYTARRLKVNTSRGTRPVISQVHLSDARLLTFVGDQSGQGGWTVATCG